MQGEDMSDLLTQKKIELMVNIALKGVKEQMGRMDEEIRKLRNEIESLKLESKNRKYASNFVEAPKQQQQTMTNYSPQSSPKTVTVGAGDYKETLNPADFAVDKIFYSGSGRA